MNDFTIIGKVVYGATIFLSWRLFYLSWHGRKRDKFIKTIFIIYCILVPLYTALAIQYISETEGKIISFIGWTAVNSLMFSTDAMLLGYIINHCISLNKLKGILSKKIIEELKKK